MAHLYQFRPGSLVSVHSKTGDSKEQVKQITEQGHIELENGAHFLANGRAVGSSNSTITLLADEKFSQITFEFGTSRQDRPCIVMVIGDVRYILLTTKMGPMADGMIKQLVEDFETDALPGVPLDWRRSIANQTLTFVVRERSSTGVYVHESKFDKLVDMFGESQL
ncbi:hypothetical protein KSF_107630 [Reticulibacter mediterranei]|uniref:Uncharacterized protein n=1 Tax=Reticulibacter mediterranei TaxID=2778369 RepID=A0A8J3IYB1_9CHLR|nr:hypothetical protein [Reticulibacter mediterranei]GHP00716.1 hypothetical protein KSF_107630 [Reticulibacter mediterranei]